MTRVRIIVLAVVVVLGFTTTASAQAKWFQPYKKGTDAIKASRWQDAVNALQQAIQIDPMAAPDKASESNVREEYFPQYFLGLAYLRLGQIDKAQGAFADAKRYRGLSKKLLADLAKYEGEIETALGPPPDFQAKVASGESALSALRCSDAVREFNGAKQASASWFDKRGVGAQLGRASSCVEAQALVADARRLLGSSQFDQAAERFQGALNTFADLPEAANGLTEAREKIRTYDTAKRSADGDFNGGNLRAAKLAYQRAKTLYPDRAGRDGLDGRISEIDRRIAAEPPPPPVVTEAARALNEAKQAFAGGQYEQVVSLAGRVLAAKPTAAESTEAQSLRNRAESQVLFASGRALTAQGQYGPADEKYASAVAKDSTNVDAATALQRSQSYSQLAKDGRDLASRKDRRALDMLLQAQSQDAQRFARDGLGSVLASLTAVPPPPPVSPASGGEAVPVPVAKPADQRAMARDGMRALFSGETFVGIQALEQALLKNGGKDRQLEKSVRAYLGVAYATAAWSSSDKTDQGQLQKAIAQFKGALAIEKSFQLSPTLVSPRIRKLFEETRPGK